MTSRRLAALDSVAQHHEAKRLLRDTIHSSSVG